MNILKGPFLAFLFVIKEIIFKKYNISIKKKYIYIIK